ncbi:uncharacterized protein BDW70DRAFT_155004 [Aspergillus foveolatus]|uniref:uncharacterized protein n=1 Tax=Aspergillus foveolatus TaxID=210207 RepID=UPI003CCDB098
MPRTYGKSKGKAKQTRLAFVPADFTSERNNEGAILSTSRNAKIRYTNPSLGTLRSGRSTSSRENSSTPKPFVIVERGPSPKDAEHASQKSERRKDEKSLTSNNAAVPSAASSPPSVTQDDDSDEYSEIVHSVRKNTRNRSLKPHNDESLEPAPATQDSDSDLKVIRSARKKKRGRSTERGNSPDSSPATQCSDSELEVIHSARKPTRNRSLKRKRTDSSEPEDCHISDESEAEEPISRPRRKLRRGGVPQPILVDEESDGEQEVRGGTSKSPSIPRTPRRNSSQDRIDIEEDLEDLQDSVLKASRTRGNVANSARAKRQLHLEALRRRRAGKKEEDKEDQLSPQLEASEWERSDDEGEGEKGATVKQPQFRNWANESESSDVESNIGANEDLDRYEDDFVLEDEDDKLGVPSGLEDMPIEFSRHAYKQLKDYFQDAVEWMVHNQLNPAFPRFDPVFKVAFDKLEAEVRGRTGSQLVSSVWNAEFRRALLARPHIEVTTYPVDLCHPCDACNRSGHPASFDMKLYGKAYSLETLEPLADAESDEEQSDNEDDEQERDRDGYILPDEDTRFYLGRHCKKNAALAHTLTHWRFHLNEWVVEHLRTAGYFSDEKILKRSQYSQKKKNKHAAKALNKMIESGEIKKLWRDFHINLRAARESTV